MHQVDQVLISDEVWNLRFACDIGLCHGDCCRLGDLGAPVTRDEIAKIEGLLPEILPFLPKKNRSFLAAGIAEDYKGKPHIRELEPNTPCPLGFLPDQKTVHCSLHHYALMNRLPVVQVKPLWCCLFPLVIQKLPDGWTINVQTLPHCRSLPLAPPILLYAAPYLATLFGNEWVEKIRKRYQTGGA